MKLASLISRPIEVQRELTFPPFQFHQGERFEAEGFLV